MRASSPINRLVAERRCASWSEVSTIQGPVPLGKLLPQGKARSDDTDELGANLMAVPPDHFVSVFPHDAITRQQQHEPIRGIFRQYGTIYFANMALFDRNSNGVL